MVDDDIPSDPARTRVDTRPDLAELRSSDDFAVLRIRLRRFVFPMTALFLAWYLSFVLMGTYAGDVMATPVFGNINVGLVLGLCQFLSTFLITGVYVRFASRVLDPRARALRERAESRTS